MGFLKKKIRNNAYSSPNLSALDNTSTLERSHSMKTRKKDYHSFSEHNDVFSVDINNKSKNGNELIRRRKKSSSSSQSSGDKSSVVTFDSSNANSDQSCLKHPDIIVTQYDIDKAQKKTGTKHMESSSIARPISISDNSVVSCSSLKLQDDQTEILQISTSMPNMAPSPKEFLRREQSSFKSSDSRLNRKFLKHFKEIKEDEVVLKSYSCALLADILLQGSLYITSHRFAFHSKIFGYETIKLFPLSDVIKIKKQKTVKIIPNAIGVYTKSKKYIFGSLIARNVTFKLMCHVLKTSILEEEEEDDESGTGSGENNLLINSTESASVGSESDHSDDDEVADAEAIRRLSLVDQLANKRKSLATESTSNHSFLSNFYSKFFTYDERTTKAPILLLTSLLMLIFLSLSAAFLLYKLNNLQRMTTFYDPMSLHPNWDAKDLYRIQEIRHRETIEKLQSSLKVHITQLNQVRISLERLVKGMPKLSEESKRYEEMTLKPVLREASEKIT